MNTILKFLLIFLFSCVFIHFRIYAQEQKCNFKIHGEVVDFNSKQSVPGAIVIIKELGKGVATDEKGHYHFENICHGKYTITCKILGYKETSFVIDLNHETDHLQDFNLDEDDIHLDHLEIKAEKIDNLTQSKSFIDKTSLEENSGQNLAATLSQISGVNMMQTGSAIAKPVIHGMHSNRVLILNNGVRQEGQQWGSEHAPEIDPFMAKKITVLKGAAGVRYGSDAIAGVIILEPDAFTEHRGVKAEFNSAYFSNGRQAIVSGILEKAAYFSKKTGSELIGKKSFFYGMRLQTTYKKGGDISTPNYRLINTGLQEFNYSATAYFRKRNLVSELFFSQFNTQIGIFSGSHIGNITDLTEAINRNKPLDIYTPSTFSYNIDRPNQDIQHNLLKLKTDYGFSDGSKLTFTFGRQYNYRKEIDILRGDRNLIQRFRLTTYTTELKYDHKPIFKLITGSIGYSNLNQVNISTNTLTYPRSATVLIPNFRNNLNGLYFIERIVKNKWEYEAGLRLDYRYLNIYRIPRGSQDIVNNSQENFNYTGTLGINYRPNAHWNYIFNLSSAWRPASVNELYSDGVHHGSASFEKGNDELIPEKALNSSITVNYLSKKLNAEVYFYNNKINNFLFLSPTGRAALTIRGAFPEYFYTQTQALFLGFDFSSSIQFHKCLQFNTKLSYLKADDISNEQPLIMIPANRIENGIRVEYKKYFFTIANHLVGKQSRVPTKLIFKNIPSQEIIFKTNGGDFAPAPAAYSLINVSVGFKSKIKNKNINLSLTANNALNTVYRDYLNRFRYYADDMGINIVSRFKIEI